MKGGVALLVPALALMVACSQPGSSALRLEEPVVAADPPPEISQQDPRNPGSYLGRVIRGCAVGSDAICPNADLSQLNLLAAPFQRANLAGANLSGSNLERAQFSGADLRGADLSYANLRGADLEGANLTGADLRCANLTDTRRRNTTWTGADLTGSVREGERDLDGCSP